MNYRLHVRGGGVRTRPLQLIEYCYGLLFRLRIPSHQAHTHVTYVHEHIYTYAQQQQVLNTETQTNTPTHTSMCKGAP